MPSDSSQRRARLRAWTRSLARSPEVLPQATLIAAAGQRHNLGDAGWQESAFAPMVAEIKKWAAV